MVNTGSSIMPANANSTEIIFPTVVIVEILHSAVVAVMHEYQQYKTSIYYLLLIYSCNFDHVQCT